MKSYLDICRQVINDGYHTSNRTGIDSLAIPSATFTHDMSEGFPLLTTKKMPYGMVASELEFFIKGITDKKWLQDRNNSIWDEWCNPQKVSYIGVDPRSREIILNEMSLDYLTNQAIIDIGERIDSLELNREDSSRLRTLSDSRRDAMGERDLGPVYGFEWRHFGAEYQGCSVDYSGEGIDQLANVVEKLKSNPTDRRMLTTAWNPLDLPFQALPPCHYDFKINVLGGKLHLNWSQRSVDVPLGLPFNIASYATLLHLLAKEAGFEEGQLTGQLDNTHIYLNELEGIQKQLSREPRSLPKIDTPNFTSLFDWNYRDTQIRDYHPHPGIKFDIAV
jgi:thymidylate synthase